MHFSANFRTHVFLLMVVLLTLSSHGFAQSRLEIGQPQADRIVGDHAESVTANPAGMTFGDPFQLSYSYVTGRRDRIGHGHALMMNAGFGRYSMGVGYEALDLAGYQKSFPSRWSWAHSLLIGPWLSLGLTWHSFSGEALGVYDDLDQLSAGFQLRALKWVAIGGTVDNINTPSIGTEELDRLWTLGLGIRPGSARYEFSTYGQINESTEAFDYGFRLRAHLFDSIFLIGGYKTETLLGEQNQVVTIGLSAKTSAETGLFYTGHNMAQHDTTNGMALTLRSNRRRAGDPRRTPSGGVLLAHVIIQNTNEYQVRGLFSPNATAPFLALLQKLRRLTTVDAIMGVVLDFRTRNMGWAQADELWHAIMKLKAAGKKVYAWMPAGDTRSYAVATAADRVFTTPTGGVLLTGVLGRTDHIGDGLRALGVEAEFVTTGDYKTFPETFTHDTPSKASIEVQNAMVDALYSDAVNKIAQGREKTAKDVRALIDDGPYTAARALKAGLVDRVLHYDEFETMIRKQFGRRARLVSADKFLDDLDSSWGVRDAVAILYITGTIADGPSNMNPAFGLETSGSSTLVQTIEAYRKNTRIKAVVVRIDSPGGSVSASDAIWRALHRLQKKKNVYVSMGDVAASGGYYVAAPASRIYASDVTITGSIGVFAGKVSARGLMKKLGVNRVQYPRGKHSTLFSTARPWTESERGAMQRSMEGYYDIFLERVSQGRPALNKAGVRAVAAGRVWMGKEARKHKLIDEAKGLMATLEEAANKVGTNLDDLDILVGPKPSQSWTAPKLPFSFLTIPDPDEMRRLVPPSLQFLGDLWAHGIFQFQSGVPLALLPFSWQ